MMAATIMPARMDWIEISAPRGLAGAAAASLLTFVVSAMCFLSPAPVRAEPSEAISRWATSSALAQGPEHRGERREEAPQSAQRICNMDSGAVPLRQRRGGDRRAGALGLARSFGGKPSRAWRRLRDLCRQLQEQV